MGRREDKKALVRQQLLDAAAALFAEKGYENTSIEDITERADFSKGTFYYHFESKDELVVELRRNMLSGNVDESLDLIKQGYGPLMALEKLLLDRAAFTEQQPELSSVFLTQRIQQFLFKEEHAVIMPPADESAPKRRFRKAIYELVCEAQKLGQIRADLSPLEVTSMVIAFYLHAQGAWLASDRTSSLVEKLHRWLHVLLDGTAEKGYRAHSACYSPQAHKDTVEVVFPPSHPEVPK
jgi:AcrR family transcriptional regulator